MRYNKNTIVCVPRLFYWIINIKGIINMMLFRVGCFLFYRVLKMCDSYYYIAVAITMMRVLIFNIFLSLIEMRTT